MSWPTIIWSGAGGVCLALAGIHLLVWLKSRDAWANLIFAIAALMASSCTLIELRMMHAETPAAIGAWLWWLHSTVGVMMIALAFFACIYLQACRGWLLWLLVVLRVVLLTANFFTRPNLDFYEISGLQHVQLWGDALAVTVGTARPWWPLLLAGSTLLLPILVVDAAITAWRRGDRRRAATIGGSVTLAVLFGVVVSQMHDYGLLRIPYTVSMAFMIIVSGMAYELSSDLIRARQLSRELEQSQQESAELQLDLAQLSRATTLNELASSLAHEINQPLGAILRNAEAAELYLQQQPPDLDEVAAIVTDIRQDDQRATLIIDRMRGLLKRRGLKLEAISLQDLVNQVASLVKSEAQGRGAVLDVRLPAGIPPVAGDVVYVQQVLLNLILNGLDAMAGQPTDRRLEVRARLADPETVEVAVSDRGHGIPAEALPHLFDPFFTTKSTGIGMGLSISKTCIEAHGGRIWAENNPDGGAMVRFTLRVAPGGSA